MQTEMRFTFKAKELIAILERTIKELKEERAKIDAVIPPDPEAQAAVEKLLDKGYSVPLATRKAVLRTPDTGERLDKEILEWRRLVALLMREDPHRMYSVGRYDLEKMGWGREEDLK